MAAMPVLAIGSDRAWRARLERILHGHSELTWLGSYAPGERPLSQGMPSLLLLDGDDPRVGRELHSSHQPLPPRLYFYRRADVASLRDCVEGGASGCLEKSTSAEAVLRSLRAVSAGLFAVEPELLLRSLIATLGEAAEPAAPRVEPPGDFSQLTERQREIVRFAAQGMSNKQIARQLGISPETVKTHLHHVFERAGISGRVALLAAQWAENDQSDSAAVPMVATGTAA